MAFQLPQLYINPAFSWGPPNEEIIIDGEPVHLYLKSDPVKAFNWFSLTNEHGNNADNNNNDDDDDENGNDAMDRQNRNKEGFVIVTDDTRIKALKAKRRKAYKPIVKKRVWRANYNPNWRNNQNIEVVELPNTINIGEGQQIIADFVQPTLGRTAHTAFPEIRELVSQGMLMKYNTALDKLNPQHPQILNEIDLNEESFDAPITILDQTMRRIISGDDESCPRIYTTDDILTLLLTADRAINPWHFTVYRKNNKFFLYQKENDGNVNMQWVNETDFGGVRPSQDDRRQSERTSYLGAESTKAFKAFIRAGCTSTRAPVKVNGNEFRQKQPRLYRYRRFTMYPNTNDRYDVVVRCEVDATVGAQNEYARLFGLLQHSLADKQGNIKPVETHGAALIPKAFTANNCKLSRWIALSLLADASIMKIGVITRTGKAGQTNPNQHQLHSLQSHKPAFLARQLGINYGKMWAIADIILQSVMGCSKDEMVVVKPTDARRILVSEMPEEEEEDDDDDDDEEEEEDEDGENGEDDN